MSDSKPPPDSPPAAPSGDASADIDLLRQRRDHLRAVYFQQESRAQVVFGVAVAVAGALFGSFGGKAAELADKAGVTLWILLGLTCGFLVLAFLLGLAAVLPLSGRHFFSRDHRLDRVLSWLGFRCACRTQQERVKPEGEDALATAAGKFLSRRPPSGSGVSAQTMSDPIFRAELYNLWALWYATVRKAGLLRLAVLFLILGLLAALPSYLMIKEELADQQASVSTSGVSRTSIE